MLIVEPS